METVTAMRCLTLLITGAALVPLAACGSDPPRPAPAPGTTASASSSPSPSPSSSATGPASGPASATGPASGPAAGPGSGATRPPATGAATPGSGDVPGGPGDVPGGPGEVPGGLPHGSRTLTGVVERSGDCLLLRVGDRRWGLTGTPAETLAAGDRVTVTGQVTTTGAACAGSDAARTLVVRRVTR